MGDSKDRSTHHAPAAARRRKKTQWEEEPTSGRRRQVPYLFEEDPAEEDPLFSPADSPHYRNGVDTK
jgi:hypothetical protein